MSQDKTKCGPCSLCNRTSNRYFHTDSWDCNKYAHFESHILPTPTTSNHVCICRACHHDIDRNIGITNHVPRWKKLKTSKESHRYHPCPIEGCTRNADVTTSAITLDRLPDGISLAAEQLQAGTFCSYHYHHYNITCTPTNNQ